MAVLGIYEGHNAGAAIISEEDGSVIAAVEEERFSRVKNHDSRPGAGEGPVESVRWCLARMASLTAESVTSLAIGLLDPDVLHRRAVDQFADSVVEGESQRLRRADELHMDAFDLLTMPRRTQGERIAKAIATVAEAGLDPHSITHRFVEHHLCHAASFLLAPTERALVVTLDGKGDGLSGSVSVGRGHVLSPVLLVPTEHSLGHFYSAATVACGLRPQRDEGKLMAMAAAGSVDADLLRELRRLIGFDQATGAPTSRLSRGIVQGPYPDRVADFHNARMTELIRGVALPNVASTVQHLLETVVVDVVRHHLVGTKETTVVVSGGIFANVSLNRRLASIPELQELHVHPGMTDAGVALGAAAWTYAERHGRRPQYLRRLDLGPSYADDEALRAFSRRGYEISSAAAPAEVQLASALAAGHVVARFVGGCEYGPRALGFRSVLAPATSQDLLRSLNNRLSRSQVMPFAPVVMAEWAPKLFRGYEALHGPLRFMTTAVECTDLASSTIPGVVHSDGTARPQLVDREVDGALADLLTEYNRQTGLMGLVNTSFNLHDEPIVCSPDHASASAENARIDVVQVGRHVCLRSSNAEGHA